jgi:hypothetical protein
MNKKQLNINDYMMDITCMMSNNNSMGLTQQRTTAGHSLATHQPAFKEVLCN